MEQKPKPPSCTPIEPGQQRLTPEQQAAADQFAQARIAAFFSTVPRDEAEAEALFQQAMQVIGVTSFKPIRWFDSPLDLMMARTEEQEICFNLGWDEDSYLEHIHGLPRIHDSLASDVWGSVAYPVEEALPTSWMAFRERMSKELATAFAYSTNASFDAPWLAYYWFLHESLAANDVIFLARFTEAVGGFVSVVEAQVGGALRAIWLTRKPVSWERDEQGRLHSSTGMCMRYCDGWGCYAWHGVPVPEELILSPEYLIKADWIQERDLDVRRAFQERLESERFVELVEGVFIDRSSQGALIEITLEQEPERMAHYVQVNEPATPSPLFLRVPPSIVRVDKAIAWIVGNGRLEYGQEPSPRFQRRR